MGRLWPNTQALGPPPQRTDSEYIIDLYNKTCALYDRTTTLLRKMVSDPAYSKEWIMETLETQRMLFDGMVTLTMILESRPDVERIQEEVVT